MRMMRISQGAGGELAPETETERRSPEVEEEKGQGIGSPETEDRETGEIETEILTREGGGRAGTKIPTSQGVAEEKEAQGTEETEMIPINLEAGEESLEIGTQISQEAEGEKGQEEGAEMMTQTGLGAREEREAETEMLGGPETQEESQGRLLRETSREDQLMNWLIGENQSQRERRKRSREEDPDQTFLMVMKMITTYSIELLRSMTR